MKRWLLGPLVVVALLALTTPALAGSWHRDHRHDDHARAHNAWSEARWDDSDDDEYDDEEDSDSGDEDSPVVDGGDPIVGPSPVITGSEKSITAELTGYSYQDNTPPGSADICCPQLHQKAGGQGTFEDPITTAVASSSFPPGTRFYIPPIKRYVIVEDSGASDGQNHLDIWVGGQGHSKGDSDACMNSFTGNHSIIQNPGPGHPVTPGELTTAGGCKI